MPPLPPHLDRPVRDFLQPPAITLRSAWTVDEAIGHLRQRQPDAQTLYFYVLGEGGELLGTIAARKLLLAPAGATLETVCDRHVIFLRESDTLFEACELFAMHRLLAIPVVDGARKLLGTLDVSLYTDEIFGLAERRADADLFQLIGLHLEQIRNASPLAGYRFRMPWLLANLVGGLVCAALASSFDAVLREVILLAVFIPVMLTLSEAVAIQSMTLAVQMLAAGARPLRTAPRELATAALLGVSAGAVVGLVGLVWPGRHLVPVVIGVAIALNVMLAALVGTLTPTLLHRLRLNPSVAAGPVALALTDVVAITLYLGLATAVLAP